MREPNNNIDKGQLLRDMARTLRRQLAIDPDTEGNTYFCLNCWQRIPGERCARCSTTHYSAPILTIEQLASVRWILNQVNLGTLDHSPEDDIAEYNR